MASSAVAPVSIEYPSSDGKPMAESGFQLIPMRYAIDALRRHFRSRSDVYVSGDMFLYYQRGNPKAVVAPDVFVVVGTSNDTRHSYFLWEEPKGPDFVLEITSRSTRQVDQGPKRELYRNLGVREYWQFDPTDDYLEPALQGLQLSAGEYLRIPASELADGTLTLHSTVLDLDLRLPRGELQFYDPATRRSLLSSTETEREWHRAEQERQHAEQERAQQEAGPGRTGAAPSRAQASGSRTRATDSGSKSHAGAGAGGGTRGPAAAGARYRSQSRRVIRRQRRLGILMNRRPGHSDSSGQRKCVESRKASVRPAERRLGEIVAGCGCRQTAFGLSPAAQQDRV